MGHEHKAVFINNQSDKQGLIDTLLQGPTPVGFKKIATLQGALFSKLALDQFIEEEVRHDRKILTGHTTQTLQSMSSGERKKALLNYLLASAPDYLILDNPFDNLDTESKKLLKTTFTDLSNEITMIQLISRKADLLPFITAHYSLIGTQLLAADTLSAITANSSFETAIPPPLEAMLYGGNYLVELRAVSVCYGQKHILQKINWKIGPGEFWQLKGKNGSGKTTLLSMITGDNPKAYGQDILLFGQKKGSGESIWDIKKRIGYFTPAMIDRFRGYHSLENMLISGLMDSIGLYTRPTETQIRLAGKWLELINMQGMRSRYFHELTMGQQRLIMCVRAMIKHPLLLILDEPTAGLDDQSAEYYVALVNKIARESTTTIIFVSHRDEPGLEARLNYELIADKGGSIGQVTTA